MSGAAVDPTLLQAMAKPGPIDTDQLCALVATVDRVFQSLEMTAVDRPWSDYPLGTLAHALGGGAWLRVEHGWQWNGHRPHPGAIFSMPGADAVLVTLPDAAEFDADKAWREFMSLLDEAGDRGLRVRFWSCPLHPGPVTPMTTVRWDGDEATCALCGYTRSEHRQRLKAATSAAGTAGLVGMSDPRATPKPPA